jgi:hypothetical protein
METQAGAYKFPIFHNPPNILGDVKDTRRRSARRSFLQNPCGRWVSAHFNHKIISGIQFELTYAAIIHE